MRMWFLSTHFSIRKPEVRSKEFKLTYIISNKTSYDYFNIDLPINIVLINRQTELDRSHRVEKTKININILIASHNRH